MKITAINIDDIIRTEKRVQGYRNLDGYAFYWGDEGWNALKEFYEACIPCGHGFSCFCGNLDKIFQKKNFKSGLRFMGVNHFWERGKKNYKFSHIIK